MNAFLVVGAESSGTRLATKVLIDNGVYGHDGHQQALDAPNAILYAPLPFVQRRSLPHGGTWPSLTHLYNLIDLRLTAEGAGRPVVIGTVREWGAMAQSQLANGHVSDITEAYRHITEAYRRIMGFLAASKLPFIVLGYEAMVLHPRETQGELLRWAGSPYRNTVYVYDGDKKYYERRQEA